MTPQPKRLICTPVEARALHDGGTVEVWRPVKVNGQAPPEWATFAAEGNTLAADGSSRKSGRFYWSEEQTEGLPLKTLRRWPIIKRGPMAGDWYWTLPQFPPGSRWWVAESWVWTDITLELSRALTEDITSGSAVQYRAGFIDMLRAEGMSKADAELAESFDNWLSPATMPRWASRTIAESLACRVELKDGTWHWVANMRGEKA